MILWKSLILLLLLLTLQICKADKCAEFTDLSIGRAFLGTKLDVRLLLYTRDNATCGTLMSHTNLSASPQFNVSKPATFIVHGHRPNGSPPTWVHPLKDLLLAREDMNVIMVDWNKGAANVNYLESVKNTRKAGDNLTAFIQMTKDHGASLSSIHFIGFSLGAHVSGFVGANLGGAIGRITALDPAGPQFTRNPPEDRLDPTDAQFVDVLHTDMDALGFREPLGHIDFYANGGADQPGCSLTLFSGTSYFKCDHQRSVNLFLESVNQTCANKAFPCSSYKEFLDGNCLNCDQFGAAGCPHFGHDVIKWKDVLLNLGKTKAYFRTNGQSPFCMANHRVNVMIWNKNVRWGYLTVKLYSSGKEAVATIDHKASEFQKFTESTLFAQFDKDVRSMEKVSVKFSMGNVLKPKHNLCILRIRLTNLEHEERPLCRYDIVLEENKEVTFRPLPCEESNF